MKRQITQMKISNTRLADAVDQSKRQADAAEESNRTSRAALLSSDRPWVFPNAMPFTLPQQASNASITITTTNNGRSPARAVREEFSFGLTDKPEPDYDQGKCSNCNAFVLMPVAGLAAIGLTDTVDITSETLTQQDIDAVKSEEKRLYVLGRVDYRDTNDTQHKSLLCIVFTPKNSNWTACRREDANYSD